MSLRVLHVDDVHRIGPVFHVHVHLVGLVSLSLPGISRAPSFSKPQLLSMG